jgi:hypothetical protein
VEAGIINARQIMGICCALIAIFSIVLWLEEFPISLSGEAEPARSLMMSCSVGKRSNFHFQLK